MKTKYKFLEFDGAELNNYLASFLVFGGDTPSYGEVALYQHAKDKEIMLKLLEIIEMQRETLDKSEFEILLSLAYQHHLSRLKKRFE